MKSIILILIVFLSSCQAKQEVEQKADSEIMPISKPLQTVESLFKIDHQISENYMLITPPQDSDFEFPDQSFRNEPYKFGDFNADNKEDVLINLGSCGTGGCIFGLFLKQYDNYYKLVFMDYLMNIEFETQENGFLKIQSSEQVEAYNPSKIQISVFKFNKDKYEYILDTTFVYHDKEVEEMMNKQIQK